LERRAQGIRERDWQNAQAAKGGPHRPAAVMAESANVQDEAELMAVLDELGTSLDGTKPDSPQMQRTKVSCFRVSVV
jgi:hypothetical protein